MFRTFEIKIRVFNKTFFASHLITRYVSQILEQYYKAKIKNQYRIVENKLGHNVYRCYQSHTGNMYKHYECYTNRHSPYKGLGLPELDYFKKKYINTHEALANLIFT